MKKTLFGYHGLQKIFQRFKSLWNKITRAPHDETQYRMHDAPHDQPNYMLYNYSRVRARASLNWVDFLWVSWGSWIIGFAIKQVNDATGNV